MPRLERRRAAHALRALLPATLILGALVAGGSSAGAGPLPDAEIFATDNTAIITDPADPRLDTDLASFAADVTRIVQHRGGQAATSQLLDGVFFSSERFPDAVQPYINALPLTALNQALRGVMTEGQGLAGIAPQLAIVALWGIASFAVALKIFRWR